jgi:hypothetical protein
MAYFSKHTLWMNQAPSFNFELDEDELLVKALKVGFVKKVGEDCYELNQSLEMLDNEQIGYLLSVRFDALVG